MTHEKDTGGPAFPQHDLSGYGMGPTEDQGGLYQVRGMTLRDWFAGKALIGRLCASPHDDRRDGETFADMYARQAYQIADAMLDARK